MVQVFSLNFLYDKFLKGKTTLIGVLTGLLKPSSGTAEMYNYDISTDMDSIRQIMGVCPQFDILWNELTAKEHLQIFAKLKGKTLFISLNKLFLKEFQRNKSQVKSIKDFEM